MGVGLGPGAGGSGGAATDTKAVPVAEPPGPVQMILKVVVCVGVATSLPESALLPLQPSEAVADVEFVQLHERVVLCP